jgi:hypothetical protein
MSKIEVDAIEPQSGTDLTIGASGDTITVPAGATLANNGTATGFASIAWQSVQTTGFTAVKGNAYPCDTTSAGFTVTLPATPSAGDQVQLVDYAGTFDTNALTIAGNGEDIEGSTGNVLLNGEREGAILTYIDSTQGWIATSGINEGTDALTPSTYSVDFLVIAGGGSGGTYTPGPGYVVGNAGSNSSISGTGLTTITSAGGGRGGAYNNQSAGDGGSGGGGGSPSGAGGTGNTPSTSPSQGNDGGDGLYDGSSYFGGGGGGAGGAGSNASAPNAGNGGNGTASSITGTSVTRAGGGGGCKYSLQPGTNGTGGTGGGGDGGNPGIAGTVNTGSGGGGGDNGGAGHGGGGAGGYRTSTQSVSIGTSITVTVGDGGASVGVSGAGGKGVVILSMPDASYSGTTTGSPTVATGVSGKTVLTFTGDGSYTA